MHYLMLVVVVVCAVVCAVLLVGVRIIKEKKMKTKIAKKLKAEAAKEIEFLMEEQKKNEISKKREKERQEIIKEKCKNRFLLYHGGCGVEKYINIAEGTIYNKKANKISVLKDAMLDSVLASLISIKNGYAEESFIYNYDVITEECYREKVANDHCDCKVGDGFSMLRGVERYNYIELAKELGIFNEYNVRIEEKENKCSGNDLWKEGRVVVMERESIIVFGEEEKYYMRACSNCKKCLDEKENALELLMGLKQSIDRQVKKKKEDQNLLEHICGGK